MLQQLFHEFGAYFDCLLLVLQIWSLFPLCFDLRNVDVILLRVKRIHDFPEEVALWQSQVLAYNNKLINTVQQESFNRLFIVEEFKLLIIIWITTATVN